MSADTDTPPTSPTTAPSRPAQPESPWLTLRQVGQVAQIGLKSLYRETKAGRLRHSRIGGQSGPIRVHESWVTAWLEAASTPIEMTRR